ncbi:cobyric acid synthase [Microvirga sp. W0021]|uniref:Cobyric acid synthase n=1 Tax=Hohaiivirga grylli TaxID=3133970 RepID=A0ABV0BFZ8_9HYPH
MSIGKCTSNTMAIIVQGTGSNVGKSLLVAGLCRAFVRRGLTVRPFKPQNMSNNAAAVEGGEIGRAQALQARAARVPATVDMNPVLLKPETDSRSQIIVHGQRAGNLEARSFQSRRDDLLPIVLESFERLSHVADIVVVEGAGSPAETNLRERDIANMGFAVAAGVPVILAGDIDRGGVIASLVGTHTVLDETDRRLIKGFLINKFRGDVSLFSPGEQTIAERTGWKALGVVPWFNAAGKLPAEDAVDLEQQGKDAKATIKIVVPMLSRIANFDDLDPLKLEPSVSLQMVPPGQPLPADATLVILPGTKATIADMTFFREQGWDIDLLAHVRRGGHVLGICGGYQMLGQKIHDPDGVESHLKACDGLGLLAVETWLGSEKAVRPVSGFCCTSSESVTGYEIHLGRTDGEDCVRPMLQIAGDPEGATSATGRVMGTYIHGLFSQDAFRQGFLTRLGDMSSWTGIAYEPLVEQTLDELAMHLETHLDLDAILEIARMPV